MEDEVKCLTGCEPGSVWKVVEVVNRMYLDTKLTHTHTHARTHREGRTGHLHLTILVVLSLKVIRPVV